jgi:hypothetical protein
MADKRIQDASWDLINSTRDANQAMAHTTLTLLESNTKFTQSLFLSGIDVLERETDDLRHLTHEWGRQIQRQQDAFQKVAEGTIDTSLKFWRAWFSLSQQVWGVTQSAVDREFQFAQDAAQRAQEHNQ